MKRLGAMLVAAVALVALVAAHLVVVGLVSARLALPAAGVAVVILVVVFAHLGALAPLSAWIRRRPRG